MVEKVADLYTLRKTTLYKLDESRQGTLEPLDTRGRQHRNSRLVITRKQMIATLRQLHDSPLSGHLGQDNTYHKAARYYYWPGMKDDIIQYVRTCKTCQKRKRRQGEAPLEPIQKTPQPFYQIGIDIMGPLPVTRTGK
jgi:hypothetical protein